MEPNPIYWLELRQLRRSPFPYVFFVAGLTMSGYLFRIGFDDNGSSPEFVQWIPSVFFIMTLFGIPYMKAMQFVTQQISESEFLQTSMSRSSILFGKLKTGVFLAILAYFPVLPGIVYLLGQNRWNEPAALCAGFVGTLCLLPVFLGFMAGVKSTSGEKGRVTLLLVFLLSGFVLFCLGTEALLDLIRPAGNGLFVVILSATCFLVCTGGLMTWVGCILYNNGKDSRKLICCLMAFGLAFLSGLAAIFGVFDTDVPATAFVWIFVSVPGFFGSPLLAVLLSGG